MRAPDLARGITSPCGLGACRTVRLLPSLRSGRRLPVLLLAHQVTPVPTVGPLFAPSLGSGVRVVFSLGASRTVRLLPSLRSCRRLPVLLLALRASVFGPSRGPKTGGAIQKASLLAGFLYGAPCRTRTCYLLIRKWLFNPWLSTMRL